MKKFILLLLIATNCLAHDTVVVTVDRVYDGDTVFVNIANWPEVVGKRIGIRIAGIDTAEIRGKCDREKELAIKARDAVIWELRHAGVITIRDLQRDKYFRILADVYADDVDVGQKLLDAGLARKYYGQTKKGWCE